MKKRNLNQEKIIEATRSLAKEIGISQITFPVLAEKLDIKYPSLYNHFKNMTQLKAALAQTLQEELKQALLESLVGKSGSEAIEAYCETYVDFAFHNESVYELLINIPHTHCEALQEKSIEINQMIQKILEYYPIDHIEVIHKSRQLRSLLHGYISLRFLGYFQNIEVDAPLSYKQMVKDFIWLLENEALVKKTPL